MTVLLATSVIRGSRQGDSHGGAFLVDLAARRVRQVLDWNTAAIDWRGRGGDRGLRGIAFARDAVLLAASDELFVFDNRFRPVASYRNPYLKHCHEIDCDGETVILTSTGFDSLLMFDLGSRSFKNGVAFVVQDDRIQARRFDPQGAGGPAPSDRFHLNSVARDGAVLTVSGLRTPGLLRLDDERLTVAASLPPGTHNARLHRNGVLFNDSEADFVRFVTPSRQRTFDIPRYPIERLTHTALDESAVARQAFGRGLCVVEDDLVAAGSSPATIALHDLKRNKTTMIVTLSMDVRTAIHGLAVWPFD